MIDLNKLINESMAKIEAEGYVEKVIETRLKDTIKSIVDDVLKDYSDFGKNLKKYVKENLNVNLEQLDIQQYNMVVLNAVQEQLNLQVHNLGVEKIKENLEKLLGTFQSEYKLSEIIEMFKEEVNDDHDHDGEELTLHVDDRSSLTFIHFDEKENVGEYSCKYDITVHNDTGKIHSIKIDDRKFDNKLIMGGMYGFDSVLFKMFAHDIKLIIDEDDVDLCYGEED